jgi:hypothetical protein
VPLPSGGAGPSLYGISCVSVGRCTAVGDVSGSKHDVPLAEVWNGSTWTPRKPPVPGGSTATSLRAVDCAGTGWCEAVGTQDVAGSDEPVIEHWNGSVWGVQNKLMPVGDQTALLVGLSCPNATACEAAGYASDASTISKILAERYS